MHDTKLDSVAAFSYIDLVESWPHPIEDLVEDKRYRIIQMQYSGYSEHLINFFSLAQMGLYRACETFNKHIGQFMTKEDSAEMIVSLEVLREFSKTIKKNGNTWMTTNPPGLLNDLRSNYRTLLNEHSSTSIPLGTSKIDLLPLKATATFSLSNYVGRTQNVDKDNTLTDSPLTETPIQPSDPLPDSRKGPAVDARKKIYSVFISSTYEDLRPVRQAVMKQLQLTEEYNPIGMEAFPAADKKQLDYIKEKMEFVDLYILILGGRYGSLIPDGTMSYSQREYEMAKDRPGIKTLAFICRDPEELPSQYRDDDPDSKTKLTRFRKELESTVMVRMWNHTDSPEEIANMVYLSLNQTDKTNLQGWVRGPVPSV